MKVNISILNRKAYRSFKKQFIIENIEVTGEEKVLNFIKEELGGWGLLDPTMNRINVRRTYELMIKLYKNGFGSLFNFYTSSNPVDPNYALIKVFACLK